MRIGKSVLRGKNKIGDPIITQEWWGNKTLTKDKVLEVLKENPEGLSINAVAKKANVTWLTAKIALLELLSTDAVEFEKKKRISIFHAKGGKNDL